jgi:glucuronoarabinoxylan endo-1,4-beta-xylanase
MQSYRQTYQVIDGFGFFGAHDVWRGNAADMWNDAWGYPL